MFGDFGLSLPIAWSAKAKTLDADLGFETQDPMAVFARHAWMLCQPTITLNQGKARNKKQINENYGKSTAIKQNQRKLKKINKNRGIQIK